MKRRYLSLLLAFLLIFSQVFSVKAQSIDFNGKPTDVKLIKQDLKTLISEKGLKAMGIKYTKSNDTLSVVEGNIVFKNNSNIVKVGDASIVGDTTSVVKNGEFYLPFRLLMETLNYKVDWKNGKISLSKNQADGSVKVPAKIVSLAPSVTETLFDLGAGKLVVGRTKYCDFPKEALKIQEVGSMMEPNIETVISLKPDMVIAQTHYKEDVLKKFQEAGIEVKTFETPKSLSEFYKITSDIAKLVGKNYEARAIVSSEKSKIATAEYLTKNIKDRKSVYYVVGTGQYGEFTYGKDTFMNELMEAAGLKNAADDAEGFKYSIEKLIAKNPDIIFGPEFAMKSMQSSDAYKSLKALKNFKIVDQDVFSRPSQRVINDGLKILLGFSGVNTAKFGY